MIITKLLQFVDLWILLWCELVRNVIYDLVAETKQCFPNLVSFHSIVKGLTKSKVEGYKHRLRMALLHILNPVVKIHWHAHKKSITLHRGAFQSCTKHGQIYHYVTHIDWFSTNIFHIQLVSKLFRGSFCLKKVPIPKMILGGGDPFQKSPKFKKAFLILI